MSKFILKPAYVPKCEVTQCSKCGEKYLIMEKYRGKCYFCIRVSITACKKAVKN